MSWNQFDGNWSHFTGRVKEKWGQLTNYDLFPLVVNETSIAPLRFVPVEKWALKNRTAVALNGNGEILVFHENKFSITRRPNRWSHFAPETIVTPLACKAPVKVTLSEVKDAVYKALPEASFAQDDDANHVIEKKREIDDPYGAAEAVLTPSCPKDNIVFFRSLFANKKNVSDLDKTLREEIETLSGAAVLTIEGDVLATRVILLIMQSHPTNDQSAEASAFTKSNVHVKIKDDGCLELYARKNESPFVYFR